MYWNNIPPFSKYLEKYQSLDLLMLEAVLPEACNFIKKETIALLLSCKIFKNTFWQNTHGKLEHTRETDWFMQLEHLNENFNVTV